MNKDRLSLCKDFTNAETIEQKKERQDKEFWESIRMADEFRRDLRKALRPYFYKKKPWYKKIFD